MDILIGLVIAMFILVAGYVGYHASQQTIEEIEGHNIHVELETLNEGSESIQILQKYELGKSII